MKKTIDITGVDPIIFVGLNDNNIKILEDYFDSKIQKYTTSILTSYNLDKTMFLMWIC